VTPTIAAPSRPAPGRNAPSRPRVAARRAGSVRAPRRVSGPIGGHHRLAQAPREGVALGGRALALVRGLPDHGLIDRLVRGRAWIPVLGVLLAGIVAMQVEILKLGATMGRALQRSATLQTQNESLQASVATLADDQRIERLAVGMGMTMPAPASLVFLSGHSSVGRAIANIHLPDPVGFASQLAAQAAANAALMPASTAATTVSGTAAQGAGPATSTTATSTSAATTVPTVTTATTTPAASQAPPATSASPSATNASPTSQTPATGAASIGPPSAGGG
jgi:cell division protein FtsL